MGFSSLRSLPNFNSFVRPLIPINTGILADTFRTSNQSQNIGQIARSFSGAETSNDLVQNTDIHQDATSVNFKDIDITAPTGTGSFVDGEPRTTEVTLGGPTVARIGGAFFQDQGISQYGFAQGVDFEGNPSRASNNVSQNSNRTGSQNSVTNLNVTAPTNLDTDQPVHTSVNIGASTGPGLTAEVSQAGADSLVDSPPESSVEVPEFDAASLSVLNPANLVEEPTSHQTPTPPRSSAVPILSLPTVSNVGAFDVASRLGARPSLTQAAFLFPASMRSNISAQLAPLPSLSALFQGINLHA